MGDGDGRRAVGWEALDAGAFGGPAVAGVFEGCGMAWAREGG